MHMDKPLFTIENEGSSDLIVFQKKRLASCQSINRKNI